MKCWRRSFLSSASILFGSVLMAMLTTNLGRRMETRALAAAAADRRDELSGVTFTDIAREAGLNVPNVWGGVRQKKYIVEVKGSGLAFFDCDSDGWIDI